MIEWLALGLVILGALTIVAAAVLANIVFFRYMLARGLSTHDRVALRAADIAFATSLLRCAVITFGGASLLVLGLVAGYGTAVWTLVIPLSPLILSAAALVYARRLSKRTREAHR